MEQGDGKPKFDRIVALINLTVVLVGLGAAGWEWYYFRSENELYTLRQQKFALEADEQKPFEYTGVMRVVELKKYPDGTNLYDVVYEVKNTNTGKRGVKVFYSFSELYLGTWAAQDLHAGEAISSNDAPDPWHPDVAGPINWVRAAYDADIDETSPSKKVTDWLKTHFNIVKVGGGLTGDFPSGTSGDYFPDFIVRARPDQYIAISVGFSIEDSVDVANSGIAILGESQLLADAVASIHLTAAKRANKAKSATKPRPSH